MKNYEYYSKLFNDELLKSCVPFWLKNGPDRKHGGLYTCLDRQGKLYSADKGVWVQGRCAYTFSLLCNIYGKKQEWLALAKSCLDFLDANCFDRADGRMYFNVTADGKPLRKRRYYFSELFYVLGNAEYYRATGDKAALEKAKKYMDFIYGIYCGATADPYKITPKFMPGTRDMKALALPMILLNTNAVLRRADPENLKTYDGRALRLISDIKAFEMPDGSGLMRESAGLNDEYYREVASCRIINPGHSFELAWFLLDEAEHFRDKALTAYAERLFKATLEFGWDSVYGGLFYFKDAENMPVEAYEHDMKFWWAMNEGIIAALKLYKATRNPEYYFQFERLTEWAFSHFPDREYGEWYGYLRRDGLPTEPPCKGNTWKGPFHLPRMLAICREILEELKNEKRSR